MDELVKKEADDGQLQKEQEVKQPVPRYKELYRKYNPEQKFEDDSQEEDAFYKDYDSKNEKLQEMMSQNQEVASAIMNTPVLADIIMDVMKGVPLEVALAKNVDLDAIKPLEGDENFDEYQKNVSERTKRQSEIANNKKKLDDNLAKMRVTAEEFFKEEGIEDDEREAYVDFIDGVVAEVLNGTFSKQSFKKMLQAFRYETDVADAVEQGEVNGRNAQIEAKRKKNSTTDGLPGNGSGLKQKDNTQRVKVFDFDSAN